MKKLFVLLVLCWFTKSWTQESPVKVIPKEVFRNVKKDADTSKWTWKRGGLLSANLAQGSLSNWAAGGDDFSMSINTYVNYFLLNRGVRYTWDNNVDFNLGFVSATTLGSRKNDDRIDLLSKYGYRVDTLNRWYASALFNFRSQFFDGYTYGGGKSNFSSSFLSPAYILISVGMDYKPNRKVSAFISPLTSRTVIVQNRFLSEKGAYGVTPGNKSFNQIGFYATLNYMNVIAKNVSYRGRVDCFSNYADKPGNIDWYLTNLFSFKINKLLSATYSLDMIYDDDVKIFGPEKNAPRLQLKSLIGIGFLMQLMPKKA